MYLDKELIIRYESLIGKYRNFFSRPIKITNNKIILSFLNSSWCINFIKNFLQEYHLCKLSSDYKIVEIKLLNVFNIGQLLKSILISLEKSMPNTFATINRNCYYGD
ncbi:MAG: hypothetical protein ACTSPY_11115 [Candidatus Helarchaeota archaeon]